MDDSLVGSLLNPKNGPPNNNTATFSYAPGVKIDEQVKNGPPKISRDSDSISDLSSKGSTVKSIFTRINDNKKQMKHIGNILETLMNRLENNGISQTRLGQSGHDSQSVTPSPEKGHSL